MSLAVQAKLLRAVENREVHRIGDPRPHRVDVRLVTATNKDIRKLVADGLFREDLLWRLAHARIEIPPLRERRLDITPLIEHFLAATGDVTLTRLAGARPQWAWHAADLLERCLLYPWPGNIRELRDEARSLALAIGQRSDNGVTGPIPPLEEALSPRLLAATESAPTPAPEVIDSGRYPTVARLSEEATRYEELLGDPEALLQAIRFEADGRIKPFADRAAAVLGRKSTAVRRSIYRALGDRISELRDGT